MSAQTISGVGLEVATRIGVDPAERSAGAANGTGIDRQGFNSCVLVAQSGAVTGAPSAQTLDVKLQHSDAQGSGFVDYQPDGTAASGAVAQVTAASSAKKRSINLRGAKRYIRAVATVGFTGGSSPTLHSSALIVLGGADVVPVADDS